MVIIIYGTYLQDLFYKDIVPNSGNIALTTTWVVDDKLQIIWKKAVMTSLDIFLAFSQKNWGNIKTSDAVQTKIRSM